MATTIIDGRGNYSGTDHIVGVSQDNRMLTVGSIISMPSVTATNDSVIAIGSQSIGSGTLVGGISDPAPGSFYPLRMYEGSALMVGGSVQTYDPIGVGSVVVSGTAVIVGSVAISPALNVTTGSTTHIVAGSVEVYGPTGSIHTIGSRQIYGQATLGSVHNIGSIEIYGQLETGSVHNIGSIEIYQQTADNLEVNATQVTDPWIVAGSVAVTTGSINIFGDITASNPSVGKEGTPHAGSPTLIGGDFNGSLVTLRSTAGSELLVQNLGSVEVWQDTNSDMQVQATQEGTWDINNLTTGSVRVVSQATTTRQITAGSIKIMGASGANFYPLLVTSGTIGVLRTDVNNQPNVLLGSTAIHGDVQTLLGSVALHGVGSVVNLGSIQVFGQTGSIHTIGSMEVYQQTPTNLEVNATQVTDPWIVLGSVRRLGGAGSVIVSGTARVLGSVAVTTSPLIARIQRNAVSADGVSHFFATGLGNQMIQVKSGNSLLKGYYLFNPGSTSYLHVYNAPSGVMSVGGSLATMVYGLPEGAAANMAWEPGIEMISGISISAMNNAISGPTVQTNLVVNIFYE